MSYQNGFDNSKADFNDPNAKTIYVEEKAVETEPQYINVKVTEVKSMPFKIKVTESGGERMVCSKDTAARAFRYLQAKGFLRVIKGASLGVAAMGKSPEYEITALSMPSNRRKANEDFKKWTEGNNFEVFNHPPENPS